MTVCDDITRELKALGSEEKSMILQRFFKTGEGQYGYGDRFLGVTVPLTWGVAKRYGDADEGVIKALLMSEWHEVRLCALLMMVEKSRRADDETRRRIFSLYLSSTERINNWDLVDLSAPHIVGGWLRDKPRDVLYTLARSSLLWDNRIAVVSTFAFIKDRDLEDTYSLAQMLMGHPHELMHKAVGWMLREAGKRDMPRLKEFVCARYAAMPRTMLRYAIEKFPEDERRRMLRLR